MGKAEQKREIFNSRLTFQMITAVGMARLTWSLELHPGSHMAFGGLRLCCFDGHISRELAQGLVQGSYGLLVSQGASQHQCHF